MRYRVDFDIPDLSEKDADAIRKQLLPSGFTFWGGTLECGVVVNAECAFQATRNALTLVSDALPNHGKELGEYLEVVTEKRSDLEAEERPFTN
jgi:hypothetical protein